MTPLGGVMRPAHTGSRIWHMLQRDVMMSSTSLKAIFSPEQPRRVVRPRGPSDDSHTMASAQTTATPHVHHGLAQALVALVVEVANDGTHHEHKREDQPAPPRRERQRMMRADHHEDDRQRQIVVVHRALLAALAVDRVGRPPAIRSATTLRWPGMITISTFATMIEPISAPICMNAPRGEKTLLKT